MRTQKRFIGAAVGAVTAGLMFFSVPAVSAQTDPLTADDSGAIAINTDDGASVFRLAFSVRKVANGTVDQTNIAYALSSCSDCQTVALAFQVVLVQGDVNVVVPENEAVAYNYQCFECLTYVSATQIVLGFDGPVRLTSDGRKRLALWYEQLASLEGRLADMTAAELNAEVQAAKRELINILETELVEVLSDDNAAANRPDGESTTSTSTAAGGSSSSTTVTTGSGEGTTTSLGTTSTTDTTAP